MKRWFAGLNQREQLSLLVLGGVLGLYLLYTAVWLPLATSRDEMVVRNRGVAAALAEVDAMVSEILLLRESSSGQRARRNLTSLVSQSTNSRNLQVSRMQPNSRGELQVRLESAPFDDVLAWLYDMEYKQGLLVREVSLTPASSAGRVNASIRLAQGS